MILAALRAACTPGTLVPGYQGTRLASVAPRHRRQLHVLPSCTSLAFLIIVCAVSFLVSSIFISEIKKLFLDFERLRYRLLPLAPPTTPYLLPTYPYYLSTSYVQYPYYPCYLLLLLAATPTTPIQHVHVLC